MDELIGFARQRYLSFFSILSTNLPTSLLLLPVSVPPSVYRLKFLFYLSIYLSTYLSIYLLCTMYVSIFSDES